jgi:hypothetical protein
MLIIDGTTETDLTLDDVENALFPPTEVMPTGLAPATGSTEKGMRDEGQSEIAGRPQSSRARLDGWHLGKSRD